MNKLSSMNNVDKENIGGPHTKITGSIYINSGEVESLVGEVARMYGYSNLLHPDIFCSARFMEAQLIKLALELFNGDKDRSCGITSTGGSESILFACLAYRNRGLKMGIRRPEMYIKLNIVLSLKLHMLPSLRLEKPLELKWSKFLWIKTTRST